MAVLTDVLDMIKTLSVRDLMQLQRVLAEYSSTSTTLSEYTEELRFVTAEYALSAVAFTL